MSEKFEFASAAWLDEAFRLVREAAHEDRTLAASFCEVFTRVPVRLSPDQDGRIAWWGRIRDGRAELGLGELPADDVDIKTIAEWEAILPSARYEIDLDDPADLARCQALTEKAVREGRIQRLGDRSTFPRGFLRIHNILAKRTA